MHRTTRLCLFAFLLLVGCAGAVIPKISVDHPASPSAVEAPMSPRSAALLEETVGSDEKEKGEGEIIEKTYACPMHPDVVQDAPGECPKCGMDLVPQPSKQAEDKGEGHGHHHGQ